MGEEIRQPDGDIAAGEWTTAPLWSKIDEGSASPDGTYIVSPNNSNTTGECSIQDPSNEGTYTAVEVRAYARKDTAGGNQRGLDGDIRINTGLQGQKTFQADLTEGFVQYTQSWTGLDFTQAEMNSLQVLFISTGTTGGAPTNRREVHIDYVELVLTYTPPAPWLPGWGYRKKIPITGQSGSGTNYQVKVTVYSGSGSDSAGVVYLANHALEFPNDIRFTDDDGITELDHWLEALDPQTSKATFWIEIQDDLGSNQEFYIYYGKSGAASGSDGDDTFIFFDGFEGASLDTNKWLVKQGAVNLEDALVESGTTTELNSPAAQYYSGTYNRTYFTYLSQNKNVTIQYYDHDLNVLSDPVTINTEASLDDHDAPAILILSDGKILVFYGHHNGTLYVKRSTNAEDITAWGGAVTVDTTTSYRQPMLLSTGDIWVFYRYDPTATYRPWCYKVSDDNGDTWGSRTTLIDFGDGYYIYAHVIKAGTTIHLAWWPREMPADVWENVYYIYSPDNGSTWRTRAGDTKTPPIDATEGDLVYDTPVNGKTFVADIQLDGSNNPYIAFVDDYKSDPADARIAFYDSGWETHLICDSSVPASGLTGGIVIDENDVMAVYVGIDVSAISEIQKWTSGDGGDTWAKSADITTGSTYQNMRPQVVKDYNASFKLFWVGLRHYTAYTDWDLFLLAESSDVVTRSLELHGTTGTIGVLEGKTTFDAPKVYASRVVCTISAPYSVGFCCSCKQGDLNNRAGQWYGRSTANDGKFRTYEAGTYETTEPIALTDIVKWNKYEVVWGGTDNSKAYFNGDLKATHTTYVTGLTQVALLFEASEINIGAALLDWFYVRNYHDPEPSVGTAGAEEENPSVYYHGLWIQGVGELALCDAGSHPLRIRKGGTTYGIELVDTSDPNASAIRIKMPGGIKAIRKYT